MEPGGKLENAVAAIRVSSVKQGTDGDSPDAQKEQIERFAQTHNITIKKFFVFMESASKEQQPMQEAIDYCKNPKNDVSLFVIKSIDRFTRGGSYSYDHLKMQLERYGVKLVDIYGVISSKKVNTLEHLGVKYRWSEYSPTKKAEILEAERAQDEMRDIMSRMIGAEIRYARMGYWVRMAPFGYVIEKVETQNGKRCILKPHRTEAALIEKMFELRCRGTQTDQEIVDELNRLGYRTRIDLVRSKQDRTKIIGRRGGKPLDIKGLRRLIENPVYAGVNPEQWTGDKPVKCKFKGLVSIGTFNQANKGKFFIVEQNGEVDIRRQLPADFRLKKNVKNPDYAYKKVVMCPECNRPLLGSASKGRLGKYYEAYHCNKRGHYFRKPKKEFEETIAKFVRGLKISPEYAEAFETAVLNEWQKRQADIQRDDEGIDTKIAGLETQAKLIVDKIKLLTSETAIKYMEEDLMRIEHQIAELKAEKEQTKPDKSLNMEAILAKIKYFMEHMEFLLLQQQNPLARAACFEVLFNVAPTYQELVYGTQGLGLPQGINEIFTLKDDNLVQHSRRH